MKRKENKVNLYHTLVNHTVHHSYVDQSYKEMASYIMNPINKLCTPQELEYLAANLRLYEWGVVGAFSMMHIYGHPEPAIREEHAKLMTEMTALSGKMRTLMKKVDPAYLSAQEIKDKLVSAKRNKEATERTTAAQAAAANRRRNL